MICELIITLCQDNEKIIMKIDENDKDIIESYLSSETKINYCNMAIDCINDPE